MNNGFKISQADLVLETDGGSRGNPGIAGSGAVIKEGKNGKLLGAISKYIGNTTNNVAEYSALIVGLEALNERFADRSVEVRADSRLVIEQMSGRWKIKDASIRSLATKAKTLVANRNISYTWVPREENKQADALANLAMDTQKDDQRWAIES